MKKNLFLGLLLLGTMNIGFAVDFGNEFNNNNPLASVDVVTLDESDEAIAFYTKMVKCQPAKYDSGKDTSLRVAGRMKKGGCHYIKKTVENYETKIQDCYFPMSVAVGYATTYIDAVQYSKDGLLELSSERKKQNAEISKLMLDYCKIK